MPDSERGIFEQAIADEPPAETPAAEPAVAPEPAATSGQERDEQGRFKPKSEAPASEPAATTEVTPAATQQPQADHRIPIAELLRERDERQAAQRERDESRRQAEALARQLEEMRRPKPQPRPDIWQNPDGYTDAVINERVAPLQQQQDAMRDQFSRIVAVEKYGEQVAHDAYEALKAEVLSDPSAALQAQRIWNAPHPWGALIAWHRNQSALKEIGSDPAAYRTKLQSDLLKDPEHRKAVIAAIEAESRGAQPAANGTRPSNITRLPPSLNRVTNAAPVNAAGDETVSDAELFKSTMRGR